MESSTVVSEQASTSGALTETEKSELVGVLCSLAKLSDRSAATHFLNDASWCIDWALCLVESDRRLMQKQDLQAQLDAAHATLLSNNKTIGFLQVNLTAEHEQVLDLEDKLRSAKESCRALQSQVSLLALRPAAPTPPVTSPSSGSATTPSLPIPSLKRSTTAECATQTEEAQAFPRSFTPPCSKGTTPPGLPLSPGPKNVSSPICMQCFELQEKLRAEKAKSATAYRELYRRMEEERDAHRREIAELAESFARDFHFTRGVSPTVK